MPSLSEITQSIINAIQPFRLEQLPGFPNMAYRNQTDRYTEMIRWYTGEALEEYIIDVSTNKRIQKYPIRINPLRGTCRKHATILFGLTANSIRSGGLPIQFIPDGDKETRDRAKEVSVILEKVYAESGGGSIFVSNGIVSQYMGGCFFAAKWRPDLNRVQITTPRPEEVLAIPDGTDYYRLKEAWIVRQITSAEAATYELEGSKNVLATQEQPEYWYIEHWTKDSYKIMVNGRVVMYGGERAEGVNPFGVVPIEYIPHIRDGSFIGSSLVTPAVQGIIKEMNLRWADMGDVVGDDAHGYTWVSGVHGGITSAVLPDGRKVINLGTGTGMTAEKPEMGSVKSAGATEGMVSIGKALYDFYRKEVDHPAVADGEDQGSQRSSLTLNVRMWPLLSHVEMERIFWSVGMIEFNKILLTMMAEKGIDGITKKDVDLQYIIQWASMIERDREALVNEAAIRGKNHLGTRVSLMRMFGDIQDTDEEWKQILEEEKQLTEVLPQTGGFGAGGDGDPGKMPGSSKSSGKMPSGEAKSMMPAK